MYVFGFVLADKPDTLFLPQREQTIETLLQRLNKDFVNNDTLSFPQANALIGMLLSTSGQLRELLETMPYPIWLDNQKYCVMIVKEEIARYSGIINVVEDEVGTDAPNYGMIYGRFMAGELVDFDYMLQFHQAIAITDSVIDEDGLYPSAPQQSPMG